MTKAFLIAAGAALILAAPVAGQPASDPPLADPPAATPPPAEPPAPVPPTDPTMAAPAASAPASAVGQPPVADAAAVTKDYPPCSKTVTDGCVQGGAKAKKSSRRKKG